MFFFAFWPFPNVATTHTWQVFLLGLRAIGQFVVWRHQEEPVQRVPCCKLILSNFRAKKRRVPKGDEKGIDSGQISITTSPQKSRLVKYWIIIWPDSFEFSECLAFVNSLCMSLYGPSWEPVEKLITLGKWTWPWKISFSTLKFFPFPSPNLTLQRVLSVVIHQEGHKSASFRGH